MIQIESFVEMIDEREDIGVENNERDINLANRNISFNLRIQEKNDEQNIEKKIELSKFKVEIINSNNNNKIFEQNILVNEFRGGIINDNNADQYNILILKDINGNVYNGKINFNDFSHENQVGLGRYN